MPVPDKTEQDTTLGTAGTYSSLHAKQGDIVVADIGHEFTIKRLHLHGGMSLHPENHLENYPILYPQAEQEWRLVGVITYVIKSVHSSCMR